MGLVIHYNLAYTVTGLALAAGLGVMFLASCIVSMVKAVRDRRRIQQHNQMRRAGLSDKVGEDQGQDRKARLNILIIHDEEKERMVKGGKGRAPAQSHNNACNDTSLADRTSPAGFVMNASASGYPENCMSEPPECLMAEVSWHESTDDGNASSLPNYTIQGTHMCFTLSK